MLIHDFLHLGVDELIEGVQLLPDQALLREECGNDRPCIFLRATKVCSGEHYSAFLVTPRIRCMFARSPSGRSFLPILAVTGFDAKIGIGALFPPKVLVSCVKE